MSCDKKSCCKSCSADENTLSLLQDIAHRIRIHSVVSTSSSKSG